MSGTIAGFTPMSTMPAPRTAARFASGSRSSASESTPGSTIASAFAAVRFVTRMPPLTSTPGCTSPRRMAPPIAPAPTIAIDGSWAEGGRGPFDGEGVLTGAS